MCRATPAEPGSLMDTVVALYRVTEKNSDLLPGYALKAEQADLLVILSFKQLYLAKSDFIRLEKCHGDISKLPVNARHIQFEERVGKLSDNQDLEKALNRALVRFFCSRFLVFKLVFSDSCHFALSL